MIVMDRTLFHCRKLSPQRAESRICELGRRCKQVEGTFTTLWHNSSLGEEWESWGKVYRRALGALAEMQGGDVRVECTT
jgi:hypothetical protein